MSSAVRTMRAGAIAITGCALSFTCGLPGVSFASLSFFCAGAEAASVAESSTDAAPAHALRRQWFMVRSLDLFGLDDRSRRKGCMKLYCAERTTASAISDNNGMPSASTSVSVACTTGPLAAVDTDLLIVPWFQDESVSAVAGLDAATGGEIARALDSKEFQGKAFDLFVTPITDSAWRARRVALIGGGSSDRSPELIRKL